MKQQLQQKLRELITLHNPSLLELSFGCKIKKEFGGNPEHIWTVTGNKGGDVEAQYFFNDILSTCSNLTDFEIIGHPIELRHLLIALARPEITRHLEIDLSAEKILYIENTISHQSMIINLYIPLLDNEEEVLQDLIDLLENE